MKKVLKTIGKAMLVGAGTYLGTVAAKKIVEEFKKAREVKEINVTEPEPKEVKMDVA